MLPVRLSLLALLVPALVVPVAAPAVAGVTCQGRTPTIVGAAGEDVTGTSGDDVIVGSARIEAGAGDDVVCTTGSFTDAGPGDDSVLSTTDQAVHVALLGPGDDVYRGGPARDFVNTYFASLGDIVRVADPGSDEVRTRGGDDVVLAGSGEREIVDLGEGDDELDVTPRGWVAGSQVAGGDGRDRFQVYSEHYGARPVDLDLRARTLSSPGGRVASGWSGFDSFHLSATRVTVTGSRGRDVVDVFARRARVDLGAGRDRLEIDQFAGPTTGSFDLGRGPRDLLVLGAEFPAWRVDLPGRTLTAPYSGGEATLLGVEDVFTQGWATVIGNAADNRFAACGGTLVGGPGADRLTALDLGCRQRILRGGPGNDLLVGSSGRDQLLGNRGRDRAVPGGGNDLCSAEVGC